MPIQSFYPFEWFLLGFWPFWLCENLKCNFWTIFITKLISIKEKINMMVGESSIILTTRLLVMNDNFISFDCFSSGWLFVWTAYFRWLVAKWLFDSRFYFPAGFLHDDISQGGFLSGGYLTCRFFTGWLLSCGLNPRPMVG